METDECYNKKPIHIPKPMSEEKMNENYNALQKWRTVLAEAEKNGFFPKECTEQSLNWFSCAIGSRLQIENPNFVKHLIENKSKNSVKYMEKKLTRKAYHLGVQFYHEIEEDNPIKAKKVFEEIPRLPYVLKIDVPKSEHWWEKIFSKQQNDEVSNK